MCEINGLYCKYNLHHFLYMLYLPKFSNIFSLFTGKTKIPLSTIASVCFINSNVELYPGNIFLMFVVHEKVLFIKEIPTVRL